MADHKKTSNLRYLPKSFMIKYPEKVYLEKLSAILDSKDELFVEAIKSSIDILYVKINSTSKFD